MAKVPGEEHARSAVLSFIAEYDDGQAVYPREVAEKTLQYYVNRDSLELPSYVEHVFVTHLRDMASKELQKKRAKDRRMATAHMQARYPCLRDGDTAYVPIADMTETELKATENDLRRSGLTRIAHADELKNYRHMRYKVVETA